MITTPKKKRLIEIQLLDEHEHRAVARFLHMTYIMRSVMVDQRYYVVGTPEYDKGQRVYRHAEFVPTLATEAESS